MVYGQVNKEENKFFFTSDDNMEHVEFYASPETFKKMILIITGEAYDE